MTGSFRRATAAALMQIAAIGAAAGAPLATAPLAAATNLMNNGGFETGDFTGWTLAGDTSRSDVSVGNPHSGDYAASLGPVTLGVLSQSIPTIAGRKYGISFWLAHGADGNNGFIAGFGSNTLISIGNVLAFPYMEFSYIAVATGLQTDLAFGFLHRPGFWDIDDIAVVDLGVAAIPEPKAWIFMIGGFALAGLALRRRRRSDVALKSGFAGLS